MIILGKAPDGRVAREFEGLAALVMYLFTAYSLFNTEFSCNFSGIILFPQLTFIIDSLILGVLLYFAFGLVLH